MTRWQVNKIIFTHILAAMRTMLKSFLVSLPIAFLSAFIIVIIIRYYNQNKKTVYRRRKEGAIFLLTIYIVSLLQMAIFFRPIGSVYDIDLIPFNTPGGWQYIVMYATVNAAIFIPVGILFPMLWKRMRDIKFIFFAGFLLSLFIEIGQLILSCGVFQTEDMIMNTIGAGIGYWIWKKTKC